MLANIPLVASSLGDSPFSSRSVPAGSLEVWACKRDCVRIRKEPDEDGNWDNLIIKRRLKRRAPTRAHNHQEFKAGSRKPDGTIQMPE